MLRHVRLPKAVDETSGVGKDHHLLRRQSELPGRGSRKLLLDRVPQILQQVEAVADLSCLRGALGGTLCVEAAPVPAHDLYCQVASKPGGR